MSRCDRSPLTHLILGTVAAIVGYGIAAESHAASADTGTDDSQSAPKAMRELIQAAQKEGAIDFIDTDGVTDSTLLRAVENGMKVKYGITVRITATGGASMSEMVTRTIQEHEAHQTPSTDLMRVTPRQSFQLMNAEVTESVDWKKYDPTVRSEEITGGGSGLVYASDRVAIVYNTSVVSPDMVPKTLDDLTKSKYKGMIGTTPYGTGWGEVAMLFGSDQTWKWAQGMAPNLVGFTGSATFGPIITGQIPIFAFTGSASIAVRQKRKGAPIETAFPFQCYEFNSINMLKGSPHPNASRLFALFLRTPEGQKLLWDYNRQDSPYLEHSHEHDEVEKARSAGEQVLLYNEADVQKYQDAFNKLVPAIDKMFQTY